MTITTIHLDDLSDDEIMVQNGHKRLVDTLYDGDENTYTATAVLNEIFADE